MNLADKAGIVGQLWIEFRNDEDFEQFMEYNDIGAPMGYMLAEGLVKELSPVGEEMLGETFNMFLTLVNITEEEVDSLDNPNLVDVLEYAYNKKNSTE